MTLKIIIDDQQLELNVPQAFLDQADDFFRRMDKDMDQGWQMSREWVDNPDTEQRCRIVADKLLSALEKEDHRMGRLMAGYIMTRMPEVETVNVDTTGEIQNTRFTLHEASPARPAPEPAAPPPGDMDRMQALAQAGSDVTKVFRVGRNWRHSVYDHARGQWRESPLTADREEAERQRDEAFKQRFRELTGESG